jgi:prepilin peptidase CpaA
MDATALSLLALAPVLVAVAYFDLRFLRIPDMLSLMVLAIFAVVVVLAPMPDLVSRLIAAGLLFAAGFVAFAFRLVGAGDVKFLSVLMLLIPTSSLALFANLFAAALLAGIVCVLALRRLPGARQSTWKALSTPRVMPVGVSIAVSGLTLAVLSAGLVA